MTALGHRFIALENVFHRLLIRHSIAVLRIAVGATFLAFGILKYFPGVSPAERLATDTTNVLFLGLVPPDVAIVIIATMECFIGICFLIGTGTLMRVAIWVLAAQFVGILSPLLIEPGALFSGPHHAPTLEGQYVLKDVTLVAAAMVIAAGTFRGGKLVREEPQLHSALDPELMNAERKLEIVLSATLGGRSVAEVCDEQEISEAAFYEWRDVTLAAAADALEKSPGLER